MSSQSRPGRAKPGSGPQAAAVSTPANASDPTRDETHFALQVYTHLNSKLSEYQLGHHISISVEELERWRNALEFLITERLNQPVNPESFAAMPQACHDPLVFPELTAFPSREVLGLPELPPIVSEPRPEWNPAAKGPVRGRPARNGEEPQAFFELSWRIAPPSE